MLKFCYNKDIMGNYKMSNGILFLLVSSSVLIVSINYYTTFPSLVNFDLGHPLTIFFAIFGILYFLFMAAIIVYKFDTKSEAKNVIKYNKKVTFLKILCLLVFKINFLTYFYFKNKFKILMLFIYYRKILNNI